MEDHVWQIHAPGLFWVQGDEMLQLMNSRFDIVVIPRQRSARTVLRAALMAVVQALDDRNETDD